VALATIVNGEVETSRPPMKQPDHELIVSLPPEPIPPITINSSDQDGVGATLSSFKVDKKTKAWTGICVPWRGQSIPAS
jgi:hypothetical protein